MYFSKLSTIEKRALSVIRYSYLSEYNEKEVCKAISDLGVHQIKVKKRFGKYTVFIQLDRPGLLIGSKGVRINKLKEKMEEEFHHKVTIIVEESQIGEWLSPILWQDF